jgi:hypothetical protein
MRIQEKQEDKERNISVENDFKGGKKKNFVIDIEILEHHVQID